MHTCRKDTKEGGDDGEVVEKVVLGMNEELSESTLVTLPEGVNQFNLKKTGKKVGVFRNNDGVKTHADRGKSRVIVLSGRLTSYLLSDVDGTEFQCPD